MVPLGNGNVDYLWDALPVACVGDEDVRAWLVVFFLDFFEESAYVGLGGHVDLVGGEALRGGCLLEVCDEVFDGSSVRGICESEMATMGGEFAGAGGSEAGEGSSVWSGWTKV